MKTGRFPFPMEFRSGLPWAVLLIFVLVPLLGIEASKRPRTTAHTTPTKGFDVPLVAVSGIVATPRETRVLAQLLERYTSLGGQENPESASQIAAFLEAFPESPHALSLWQEKAAVEWRHGLFEDALASLQAAWEAGKSLTGIEEIRLAEAALSELLLTLGRLGKKVELRQYVDSIAERPVGGTAQEALLRAKETLWFLENKAEQNIFCGFTAANTVCVPRGKKAIFPDVHDEAEMRDFIANGLSLFELRAHSHEAKGDLRILKRAAAGSDLPVPSIIHWKFDHYSAVTERSGDKYRVKDDHLKYDGWISGETLRRRMSGYLLAPATASLPSGYAEVSDDEAKSVFGRHCTHARDDEGDGGPDDKPNPDPGNDDPPPCPMAQYGFRLMNPGLEIYDTPISYRPPYGPGVGFKVEFDQRSTVVPDLQQHANFGPRWTYGYLGYVTLAGTGTPSSSVKVVFGNGNYYSYSYSTAAGTYTPKNQNRPQLSYLASGSGGPGYRLRFENGWEWIYTQPNSATPTRYYLTAIKDPSGNTQTLSYDASKRLTSITDAVGQVTSLSYSPEAGDEVPADTNKIRRITDPFGRSSAFKYTPSGQLKRIVDPIGIVSEVAYAPGSDFITSLTTPYGTSSFVWGELPGINQEPGRFIEATDPNGDKERAEANDFSNYPQGGVDPNPAPASITVAGQSVAFYPKNDNLFYRNTFFWDKLQMKLHPRDFSKATIYNWKAENAVITGILSSVVKPLEGRVWFNYPGQASADSLGTHSLPSKIVRAVEKPDGALAWTMTQQDFDPAFGKLRRTVDQLGRETIYEYNDAGNVPGAVQGIDLTAVKVKQDGVFVVVARYSDFVAHQPQTVTDAAGQITRYTWNSAGQITSMKNARNEITTFSYYAANTTGKQRKGRLEKIDGALAGGTDIVTFDYDAAGNVAKVTGPDGYFLNFAYDALDRLTRVTYPDATFTETVYDRLDPLTSRDRLGRVTQFTHNSARQRTSVTDAAQRKVRYDYCNCGDMNQLIDPMNRITTWRHDIAGRVTAKVYPDGSTVKYAYQPFSGRLSAITDEKGQVKTRAYNLDDTLAGITYAQSKHPTPNVTFTYDVDFRRLKTMVDGIGSTLYAYHPIAPGTLGAGQLASVDGPLPNDTLTYTYDELGRNTGYAINGIGEARSFDPLGRLLSAINPLGTFRYTYAGATNRMDKVTYPNGMTCQYNYHPVNGDFRLKDIIHTLPGNTLLSRHSYTYNAVGNITRWTQISPQAGLNRSWFCGYDAADQLTSVNSQHPDTLANLPTGQYAYGYDLAGNRLMETIDGVTTTATFNALNQLVGLDIGGVSILPNQTYEWDAEDRLVTINYTVTDERSEFRYDGYSRRIAVAEKAGTNIVQDTRWVWDGVDVREQRSPSGGVSKRFLKMGVQDGSDPLFCELDQLGSIRGMISSDGNVSSQFDYDPFGRRSKLLGNVDSVFGFTGHFLHSASALNLTLWRAYDARVGRWLTRDPLGERITVNLYEYCRLNPLGLADPLGLTAQCPMNPNCAKNSDDWRRENRGGEKEFHCAYAVYKEANPFAWPSQECAYDEGGELVGPGHPYEGCAGTPNYFPDAFRNPLDPLGILHTFFDSGGIYHNWRTSRGATQRHRENQGSPIPIPADIRKMTNDPNPLFR